MKSTLLLTILIALTGCKDSIPAFEEIPCSPSISAENDNMGQVFMPCRQYIYSAKYWDGEYNLISDEQIWVMATGQDWEYQPESQDEIIIQYNFSEEKIEEISSHNINKTRGPFMGT